MSDPGSGSFVSAELVVVRGRNNEDTPFTKDLGSLEETLGGHGEPEDGSDPEDRVPGDVKSVVRLPSLTPNPLSIPPTPVKLPRV